MSLDFIKKAYNSESISRAVEQEKQLSYLTLSKLQENSPTEAYLNKWAESKFQTDDHFLNWIKSIFKTENFLSFYKYMRFPLPSSKIIKDRIEPQIKRVFNAEDAEFSYSVRNRDEADFLPELDVKEFNRTILDRLLYRHNSILIHDLEDINTPYRYFIDIDKVVSIQSTRDEKNISKIAFRGEMTVENQCYNGFVYIDSERYAFFEKDKDIPVMEVAHDLGYCPAFFITPYKYNNDFVIREGTYTYDREEIEMYNFLKTLQKITDSNMTFPVISKLETSSDDNNDIQSNGEVATSDAMGSARQKVHGTNINQGGGDMNPGTVHEIKAEDVTDESGNINMDIIKNYINFHYAPPEILEFINKRIKDCEVSIISTIVGDFLESTESSKNESQISKSVSVLENTLTSVAEILNYIRYNSDKTMLSLKYGADFIQDIFIHYGTDFFLDSESKLFEQLKNAPNTLERKHIIVRINQNRYKNNRDAMTRSKLLYDLMPYISDKDFDRAVDLGMASDEDKQYYLRFTYWIGLFEATYMDIVQFYKNSTGEQSERLAEINNLIINIIQNESNSSTNI